MPEARTHGRTDARGGHADTRTGFSLLLAVRDGGEQRLVQPEGPAGEPLGVATGTEVAAPAGEGEQVLVGADVAADAGEAVLQDAAGEESVDDCGDDGAPRAVGMGEPLVVDQAQVTEAAVEQAID